MPEGYTHIRVAKRAALNSDIEIKNQNLFAIGANGPDILFSYKAWQKVDKRDYNLPKIGGLLHDVNTGAFLKSLLINAKTEDEREYVLGFLSHYAADCTVHPFIVMLSSEGGVYAGEGGHGYSEIAIDSFLHERDTGTGIIRVDENTPKLEEKDKELAAALLRKGVKACLGLDIPKEPFLQTFEHTRYLRRFFVSPYRVLYGIFYLVEPMFGKRGFITGHVTPAKLKPLPERWTNPFTGIESHDSLDDLMAKAEKLSSLYMRKALSYWAGEITIDDIGKILGSRSYLKGIEDEMSAAR